MRDDERVERLERIVVALLNAILREGTDRDGNWGWPDFRDELRAILTELQLSN